MLNRITVSEATKQHNLKHIENLTSDQIYICKKINAEGHLNNNIRVALTDSSILA